MDRNESTISGLLAGIGRDLRELLRLEVDLAKNELTDAIDEARTAAILLGSASVVGSLGFAMLPVAGAFALGLALPLWAGFLLVGVTLMLLGGGFAWVGVSKLKGVDVVPHRAIDALQHLRREEADAAI